jgi:transcriptional regulator with XRE-family HTH domain
MTRHRRPPAVRTNDYTIDAVLLNRLLDEKDWTQAELAEAMGVSKSSVSRVLRYQSGPSAAFIFAIMRTFPEYRSILFIPMPDVADGELLTS